jgi:hypothetical protein
MLAKLQELENKYLALEEELSNPDLLKDQKKYQEIAKRHADLRVIVQSYRQDRDVLKQIDENKVLLDDPDQEIRELCPRIPMTKRTCFWKSGPVRAETRLPFLQRICSVCTAAMLSKKDGKWRC